VFLSGLVCALLAGQDPASAASLDQLGADHLASLDDATTLAQESDPNANKKQTETATMADPDPPIKKQKLEKTGGPGSLPPKPGKETGKKKGDTEGGDDCSKLAKAAGECVRGKRGGKDAEDKQKDKEKKDTEDKNTRDSYYW